jgi:hypothetical protein
MSAVRADSRRRRRAPHGFARPEARTIFGLFSASLSCFSGARCLRGIS